MYKLISSSTMPKFLKVILQVLLTLTCIYWIGVLIYRILEGLRQAIQFISDKRNWWTFIVCIAILVIGGLLLAQFKFGLNPFGNMAQWFADLFNSLRSRLVQIIGG